MPIYRPNWQAHYIYWTFEPYFQSYYTTKQWYDVVIINDRSYQYKFDKRQRNLGKC